VLLTLDPGAHDRLQGVRDVLGGHLGLVVELGKVPKIASMTVSRPSREKGKRLIYTEDYLRLKARSPWAR